MLNCPKCGFMLRDRKALGDPYGELVCVNSRCGAYYTFKYLEERIIRIEKLRLERERLAKEVPSETKVIK